MSVSTLRLVSTLVLFGSVGLAAESDPVPVIEEEVEVRGEMPSPTTEPTDLDDPQDGREVNIALVVERVPGVAMVRRAADAAEPVIRGLGWERVQTQINGLPVSGACPGRMDPPATLFSGGAVERASVVKGLGSVTLGPGGTGGRLDLSTDFDRGSSPGRELRPWAEASYDGARDGFVTGAGLEGGGEQVDFAAGAEVLRYDDYTSADGIEVPAAHDETGAHLSFGHRIDPSNRWRLGVIAQRGEDIDYPSLPMNTEKTDTRLYDAGYRLRPAADDGVLSEVELRLGYVDVSHVMSNRGKPNRPVMEAETESDATTWSAGASAHLEVSGNSTLEVGLDHTDLERDALRERYMVTPDTTSYDHLWPDVGQEDTGAFAELRTRAASAWKLRFGLRYDRVSSAAAAVDDPSLSGRTVLENYVYYYGADAADTDRDETLFSGNAMAIRDLSEHWSVHAGIGQASRAAGMTERFFSFALSPKGYVVGNPTLDAERKREIATGVRFGGDRLDFAAALFYHDVDDFIHDIVLDRADVNGDGTPDVIRGFRNVDATLYGGEVSALLRIGSHWTLPTALAYVRAENDDEGKPLPEIPPLEGGAALRYAFGGRLPGWAELGGRFVDDQHRIDAEFPEDETPGFAVWHLRGRLKLGAGIELQVGVENLFDKEYHEHLTRETKLPVGDLAAGGEVPQPGRSVVVALRYH